MENKQTNKFLQMVRSYRLAFICLLLLVVLTGLRLLWVKVLFPLDESFRAEDGVIDLRGVELTERDLLTLDGEWEWYPDQLLTQQQLASNKQSPQYITVPGNWSKALNPDSGKALGYGTYHLRILTDPLQQPVMLWFKGIQASVEVEVNGELLATVGKVGTTASEYKPQNYSFKISNAKQGETAIELTMRVANFDSPYTGGITRSVQFSTLTKTNFISQYSIAFQFMVVLTMLLHALYACIIYFYRSKDHSLLITALVYFSVGVAVFSGHDKALLLWLPVTYSWMLKLRITALLWQNLCVLLTYRKFSGIAKISQGLKTYIAVLIALTVVILLAPTTIVNTILDKYIFMFVYLISYFWIIWVVGRMVFQKQTDRDVHLLLITGVSIISNLAWSINDSFSTSWNVYYPLDLMIAVTVFSTYWFKRYLRNSSEVLQLYEQLKVADKMKDRFLANTSHELRTPLHGIMNVTSSVYNREKDKLEEVSRKELELVGTVSRRMSHLLDDLLDVARLQEHRVTLQPEPFSLQATVTGVMAMLQHMTNGKPIELKVDISPSLPQVVGDEKRIVQIMYNLLHNALKYTETGTVAVTASVINERVEIRVTDTGVGMDQETQAKIFVPYMQGPDGIRDGRGIGLGLSICKQLLELHGTELAVESQHGQGSAFSFSLPVAQAGATGATYSLPADKALQQEAMLDMVHYSLLGYDEYFQAEQSSSHEPLPGLLQGGNLRILAVDDDPINLNVLAGILSSEPYELTTVCSAQEALELLERGRWDLLIADVMMPQISGYELTQRVRERFTVSELPVLLLTARSQPADIYTGFLAGANDYVTKPADGVELKYRIRALITLKQSIHDRLRIEAAYLQAQIQPHFLFNTLNSLMVLSEIDTDEMRKLGDAFASYLRISFNYLNTSAAVQLSHELELVEAYLYIEKARFGNRLQLEWEVDSDIELLLPPLSIQPLIENAVRHGLMSKASGGTIRLVIAKQADHVLVQVHDNGIGISEEQIERLLNRAMTAKGGIGIANTNRRLIQLYGQGLTITSKKGRGTTVSFSVPII